MFPRLPLLKCIGKSLVKHVGIAVGFGFLGDVILDVGEDVWKYWEQQVSARERQAELEALAQAAGQECRAQVAEVVREVAAGLPAQAQQAMEAYLLQIPAMLRRSLRRPADPSGRTVPPSLAPRNAEEFASLLSPRLPRFHPGDRPLPGVDWELVELLGVGGFGEVWKARNRHFDSLPPAALKFCLDPAARDRLLRHEAAVLNQVMSQGVHPGIVRLQHTYLDADPPCLQYEYVEGGDLAGLIREWHAQPGGPSPERVMREVLRLAEIVGFAHRLRPPVVHRDLKPANILVARAVDGEVTLKVADFGIGGLAAEQALGEQSRRAGAANLASTAVRGSFTPLYASPQQVQGGLPDTRDDVHALGVIWYQMLTGDLRSGAPAGLQWPKRLLERGMTQGQVDLLATCFEMRAEDRPADAAVLADRLHALVPAEVGRASSREIHCLRGHHGPVHAVALSCDGRLALSGGDDHTVRLWDVTAGEEVRCLTGHTGAVYTVAFSPDGRHALTGSDDRTLRLWEVGSARELACWRGHGAAITGLAFSSDGRRALSGSGALDGEGDPADCSLRLWDVPTGRELRRIGEHSAPVLAVSFCPDGVRAVTGGWDHRMRLWHVDSGRLLREYPRQEGPVWSVAASSDGRHAVSGSTDAAVRLWELSSGRELRRFEGHGDWVLSVALSADNTRVLSGCGDGKLRLWDAGTADNLCTWQGHGGSVRSVAFGAEGRHILSGGQDGMVRLWTVPP
jgi:serine/threonine protein kinase